MINEKNARSYCCEDISLIRGYERAVNDNTQMYDIHHLEGVFYTKEEMIRLGKYYKQPAMALIFLTKSEHTKIHIAFDETRRARMSESSKGRVFSKETRDKISSAVSKPVFQYSLSGVFIREWPSATEVQSQLGYEMKSINNCCRGRQKTAHGYMWSYEKRVSIEPVKYIDVFSKEVHQYSLSGDYIRKWPSVSEAARELGVSHSAISVCCRGGAKSAYGYVWSYEMKDSVEPVGPPKYRVKAICQYTLGGELIKKWESGADVQRQLGYDKSAICMCCRGKQKTAYGFIWRYTE